MAFDDVVDSVKEWLSNRLKNPYFASVFVVWLIVNRIEIFGLFNFNDTQTVQDRVLWMQQHFHNKDVWELGKFKGFSGTVWFSLIFGFITMIGFKFLKVISGIVYNFFDKRFIWLQKWDKPSNWKPIQDFEDLQREHVKEKEIFEKLRTDLIKRNQESETDLDKIKRERDIAVQTHSTLSDNNGILQKQTENLGTEIQTLLKERKELKEESNKKNSKVEIEDLKIYPNKQEFISSKKNGETDIFGRPTEIQNFLKSEYVKSFDSIMDLTLKHLPISPPVSEYVRDYYLANDLIGIKENHSIITPKGQDYYKEYLKIKEYK